MKLALSIVQNSALNINQKYCENQRGILIQIILVTDKIRRIV